MRTRLLLLLACLGAALLTAAPASALTATSVDEVVDGLLQDQVFLADDADVPLDEGAVQDIVRGSEVQVYVAAVSEATSEAAGGDASLVQSIGSTLGDSSAVVLLITDGPSVYADNGRAVGARGVNAGEAARAVNDGGDFDEAGVTSFVRDFVAEIDAQAAGGGSGSGSSSSGGGALLPVLAVGAVGGGAYLVARSRKQKKRSAQELEDLRADVESLYGRLGSDVQLLAPGDDEIARQALADAAES